ncbi:MAG: DUF4388 domain-containing protein [Gemmatimonadota bacterium]
MAIKGSLKEASLPDVIQLLFLGRRTGCLALSDRQRLGSIFFEEGWITYATIVNRRDRLGDTLLRSGAITREQLDQALAMQQNAGGRRLGELLVSLGAISAADLKRVVRVQIEEAVYALFAWTSGSFSFEAGVRPEWESDLERISPESLMLEGARRVDEWSVIEKKVPSFDLIFGLDRAQLDSAKFSFTEAQRKILPLIDGMADTRAMIDRSGLSDFEAGQALYGLITAGLAHHVGTSVVEAPSRLHEAQIEEHRNLGVAFFRTEMLDEARREFRRVAELRPSEGTAPFYLGLIAARLKEWNDAAEHFRRALDRTGPRGAVLHNLAVALEHLGQLDQADAMYADASTRATGEPRVLLGWALLALKRDEPVVAWVRLQGARDLFGATVPPLWFFAATRALARNDQLEPALIVAREGVVRFPQHPVLRNDLLVLLEASGETESAEAIGRELVRDEPPFPQPYKNLGDLLYRSGRYDEAAKLYERAAVLDPDLGDDLFFKLGNLAFRRRETARARDWWERALVLNPGHQLARANLNQLPVSA